MSGGNPCLSIGQAIGSYKVVRQLGEGGMGEVYEVFDEELQRRAALKVVPPELARNPDVVSRFQREAKALSQLRHPGVVHVFVYGVLPFLRGAPYFIMEYLEGETLRALIQKAAKQPEGRLGIAYLPALQQIAKALAAVHQRGLVHRDLKPSNIILVADPDAPRGERVKLLDFGIVKILQEASAVPIDDIEGQTQHGMLLGTPLYMAPEQWKNHRRIDGKVDVYSLAVMMFLVLTGRMPFRAPDTPGLCFLHCNKAPPSLDRIDPSLPPALVDLVSKMLAKDPGHRPTMDEIGSALGVILTQPAVPRSQSLVPDPSGLDIIIESEGDESNGLRVAKSSTVAGEHSPLVDAPPPSQSRLPGGPSSSETLLVLTPSAEEAPGWADDQITTTGIAAAESDSLSQMPELSEHSLLVGSQYNLRPMLSYRAWVSTAALFVVVLLIVGVNVFNFTPLHFGAGRSHGTLAATAAAPSTISPSPPAPPPSEPLPKAKLKKNCQHMMPNPSCVTGQHLTAPQQAAFLGTFMHSDASLCAGDRLVLSGLPAAPRLEVIPKSMTRKARANLLHDLKELPGSLALPEQLEVLCPDP